MRNRIVIILLFWSGLMYGQPINSLINDVVIPTPESVAFGKFNEIPVNHATGSAQISIPLHSLQEGNLTMPLTLRYHSSGIRVSEIPSWVGSGWNLNTGAIVSRVVQGRADDGSNGYYHTGLTFNPGDGEDRRDVMLGQLDGEPDLFNFSIPGYSGKFYINASKEVVLMPAQDVKIIVSDLQGLQFRQFTIIDPMGTRYLFGYHPDTGYAREIIEADTDNAQGNINTWFLVRVESADQRHHINYIYVVDDYSYDHPQECTILTAAVPPGCEGGDPSSFCPGDMVIFNDSYALSKIETSTDTVSFTGDHTGLDEIEIKTGAYCKQWDFTYDNSIFGSRLTLTSLQERSCNNSLTIPAYQFTYNSSPTVARSSNMIDHWGYYNGQSGNDNIASTAINIPPTTVGNTTHGSSNRDTDEASMISGSLQQITYPSGGYTTFNYDANDYPTTLLTAPAEVLSIATTPVPTSNCVTQDLVEDGTYTFSTQDELDLATVEYGLTPGYCPSSPNEEVEYKMVVTLDKFVSGNWQLIGSNNFTTESTSNTIYYLPFDDLNDTGSPLSTGQYRVTITTTGSEGYCKLFTQSTYQGNMDVGGLRIAQKTHYDGLTNNNIITTYTYRTPSDTSLSSGVLLRMPKYGQVVQGYNIGILGSSSSYNYTVFRESSLVPLSTLEGYHIYYTDVIEHTEGDQNGYITYSFQQENTSLSNDFPLEPGFLAVKRGKLDEMSIYDANDNALTIEDHSPVAPFYSVSSNYLKPYLMQSYHCNISGGGLSTTPIQFVGSLTLYHLQTDAYQIAMTSRTVDGVETVQDFTYDLNDDHYQPVSTSLTNSDDNTYHTRFIYPHDVTGAAYDSMVSKNMIIPVETKMFVESTTNDIDTIGGNRTNYELFTFGGSLYPKPRTYQDREVTWANHTTYQDDGYVTQDSINAYDANTGNPSSITMRGWAHPLLFFWNNNGTLSMRSYLDYETEYLYEPGTRLLDKVINIDGTEQTYSWDQLFRMAGSVDINGVPTILSYHYGLGSNLNYIKSRTVYNDLGGQFSDIKSLAYYDGLYRPKQQKRYLQMPDQTNSILTEADYDIFGRAVKSYEPYSQFTNENSYDVSTQSQHTLSTYEPSPLNRLASTKPPGWYATTVDYGANGSNEVFNHEIGMYYTPNTLYKQTTTDPEDQVTEIFTDKRGNQILSRVKKNATTTNPNEIADTYTIYDRKDRPIIVLPPQTDKNDTDLIFKKFYSGDNLIIKKDDPDCDPIEMVYNDRDLMTYRQDGERKAENKWYAITYDSYGQIAQQGFAPN